jgi:hypothetical protein
MMAAMFRNRPPKFKPNDEEEKLHHHFRPHALVGEDFQRTWQSSYSMAESVNANPCAKQA